MYILKLSKSISLSNGDKVDELSLDFDSLSFADLKNAKKIKHMISTNDQNDMLSAGSQRLDSEYRIGLAWVAAVKGTKGLCFDDCLKLSAKDAMTMSEVALTEYCFD